MVFEAANGGTDVSFRGLVVFLFPVVFLSQGSVDDSRGRSGGHGFGVILVVVVFNLVGHLLVTCGWSRAHIRR